MKILYVEDSADDASSVQRIATYMGHVLIVAATGAEGRALMAAQQPDLVLLDINLPDANGLDLARRWREEGHTMPIIAITSDLISYSEDEARQAGCDAFLAKPVSVDDVKELFARFSR